MTQATLLTGDALEVLRTLPDRSVRCCVTSPPFWGLRDYGTATWEGGDASCDHLGPPVRTQAGFNARYFGKEFATDKQGDEREPMGQECRKCGARRIDAQLGLERTPEEYVARMVEVFREVRRVLTNDGTIWVNLGDSYAANRSYQVRDNKHTDVGNTMAASVPAGCKPKDLVGIPWSVAFALRADGWYLRSEIIWAKPNPMPESVTDRPTKAHEQVFLLSKRASYYYDAEAIAEPSTIGDGAVRRMGPDVIGRTDRRDAQRHTVNDGTRNARTVWEIGQVGRPAWSKHRLNVAFFSSVETEEQAYWLGFLYADGYVGPRHVDLQLAEQDHGHLIRFRDAVGSSHEPKPPLNGRSRVVLCSKQMANDLRLLGMGKREAIPAISPDMVPHFVRGVFDGDGSIWKYLPAGRDKWRYGASFLGEPELLFQIRDILGLRCKPRLQRGIHRISIASVRDIERLYHYLYDGANVYLERKRSEFPQEQSTSRDVWPIATQPYAGAHFATFPVELARRCILAGTSQRGQCPECGKPWVRVVEKSGSTWQERTEKGAPVRYGLSGVKGTPGGGPQKNLGTPQVETVGWAPTCDHGLEPIPDVVLDPFSGSGTTAAVAVGHGRNAIGIELNPKYQELARQRIGPLLVSGAA